MKTAKTLLLAGAMVLLFSCDSIQFDYGRPNCKNAEPATLEVNITQQNLDSQVFYSDANLGFSTMSYFQTLYNVCPGDSVTLDVRITWDRACPEAAYFGAAINYNSEVLENVPLTFSNENNYTIATGSVTAIAPSGETGTEFTVFFEALFEGEDKSQAKALFDQYLVGLEMTFRYSKNSGD
jgi:hypothetical protein